MSRKYRTGVAAVTAASALWGTTGTAATFTSGVGPLAIGAAALGIGGVLQALIAAVLAVLIVGERPTPTGRTGMGIIALVLVILAVASTNENVDSVIREFIAGERSSEGPILSG